MAGQAATFNSSCVSGMHEQTPSFFNAHCLCRFLIASLAWLHERNVTHCDIKVSNLLVDIEADPVRGRPMLVDFGFATLHDSTTNFMSSRTWGTPEYLSPERSRGDYHDERLSDVWALGVTFFELATGRTPFERENEQFLTKEELQVYYMRTQTSRWVGHWYISESLEMLCRLMLEPDPARRIYASEALHHPFFLEENPTYDLGDVDDSQVTSADSLYLSTLQASAKMSWAAEQRRMDIGVERNGEESIALHHGAGAHGYAHGHESRYPSIPSQLDSFEHLPLPHTEADASALEHTPPAKPPKDSRREQVRIIVDETVEGDDETPERDCGRFAAQTEVLGKGEPKRGIAMSEANAIGRLLQKGGALTEKVNGRSADTFADAERGLDLDQRENESPMTSGNQLSAQMMVERAGTTTSEHLRTRQNLDYLFARPITVHGAQFDMNTSHGRWGEPKHLEKHTASDDAAVPQLVIPKRASALGSKLFDDRQSNRNGAQHGTIHEGNETAEPCEEVYGPDAHHNQLTLDAARRGYAITSPPGLTTIGTPSDSHSAGLRYDERKYQEMKEIKRRVEEFKRMPWLQSNQTSAINPDYGPEELHRMLIELDQLTVTLTDIVRQTHSALDRYYHRNINCSASAYDHNISHSDDQHHPRPLALGAPEKKHKRHISLSKLQLFGARKQSNTSRRHMASPHVPLAAHRFPPPGLTPPLLGETGYAYVKGVKAWPNNPMVSPTMLSDIICSSMGFPPPVQQSMPCSSTSTTLLNRQSSMNSATSCIVHPTPSTYAHKGCYCASKPSPAIQDATQAAHPERNASCTGVTANIMEPAASNEPLTTACKVDAEGPRPYDSPVPVDMQAQMGGETNCNPVGNKLVSKFGRAAAEEVSPPAQAKPVHIPYTNTMKGKLSKVKSFTLGRSRSINIVGAHRNSEVKSGEKRRNTAAELVRGYHATKYGPQTIHRADVSAGRHMPDTPPTFGTPNNVQQALSAGQTWTQPRPVLDPIMTQSSYRSGASPCAGTIFAAPSHYPGQAYGVCPTSSHRPLIAEDPPHPQPSTRSFESAFKTPVSPTSGGSLWRMLTSRVSNSRNGGR